MAAKSPLQQHGIGRTIMVRGLVSVLIVAAGYLVFEYGRINAGYDVVDAAAERQAFEDHIQTLNDEIADLKQEVAMLETHREVDREAYKDVEASLVTLQAKDPGATGRNCVLSRDCFAG